MFSPVDSHFFTPTHTSHSLQSIDMSELMTHAVTAILLGIVVDMMVQKHAAFRPENSPFNAPNLGQFKKTPSFFFTFSPETFNDKPAEPNNNTAHAKARPGPTNQSSHTHREPAQATAQQPVDQIVGSIQALAKQTNLESKARKEMEAIDQSLLELRQANSDKTKKEATETLQTSVNKLVRRMSLYLHPDKNTSAEATEAFKQLHHLRDELDTALQAA